jgi:hypothetical protein
MSGIFQLKQNIILIYWVNYCLIFEKKILLFFHTYLFPNGRRKVGESIGVDLVDFTVGKFLDKSLSVEKLFKQACADRPLDAKCGAAIGLIRFKSHNKTLSKRFF